MERRIHVRRSALFPLFLAFTAFPSHAATLVGNTTGNFSVSANGSAVYSLSLTLPPGVAGMAPDISLVYSSGAGDGEAGWGWGLSGFPAISRCAASYASNGRIGAVTYDSNDRLCLDGNPLMLVSGTYLSSGAVYRGEIDNFTRVTQVGSGASAHFKAELKNGRILFFGSSANARVLQHGGTAIHTWALSRVDDRSANVNTITYAYSIDTHATDATLGGALLPESVSYGGHVVDFVYESRPTGEARRIYRDGTKAGFTRRLDRVDVKFGTTVVRHYQLTYESTLSPVTQRSRLASIQECGTQNGVTDCYKPLTFAWQDATSGNASTAGWYSRGQWFDANGDGLDDAVFHGGWVNDPNPDPFDPYDPGGAYTKMAYATSIGNGAIDTSIDSDIVWDEEDARYAQPMEFNGDGKLDMLFEHNGNLAIAVWNNGYSSSNVVSTNIPATSFTGNIRLLDVNGDGYTDIVEPSGSNLRVYLNTYPVRASGFVASDYADINYGSFEIAEGEYPLHPADPSVSNLRDGNASDFDGDGRQDLLLPAFTSEILCNPVCKTFYHTYWHVVFMRFSESTAAVTSLNLGEGIGSPMLGDVNGDGLSDIVYLVGNTVYLRLSKGLASVNANDAFDIAINTGVVVDHLEDLFQMTMADINRDGMHDLLFTVAIDDGTPETKYRWRKAISTGADFASPIDSGFDGDTGTFVAPPRLGVLDQNGDGVTDVIMHATLNKAGASTDYATMRDILVGITDAYGLVTSIVYAPLHTVHDWEGQVSVPNAFRHRPRRDVVASYTSSDGSGGTFTVDYRYSGGMMDRSGRGFLGFVSRTAVDDRLEDVVTESGIVDLETKTTYVQAFPYTGMVKEVKTSNAAGTPVTLTRHALNNQCFMNGTELAVSCTGSGFIDAYEKRYNPYAWNTVEQSYAVSPVDGTVVRSVRTNRSDLDNYGNPQFIVTTLSTNDQSAEPDATGIRTSVVVAYQNDTSASLWCLGQPTSTTTTSGTQSRTSTATYANCRVTSRTTGYGTLKPATVDYLYDAFGNVETETLNATGETSRITVNQWSLDGRFLEATTRNPLGHRTEFTWHPETGLPKMQTDPNGLSVEWSYDALGNRTLEKRPDGTETAWSRAYCSTNCSVTNGEYQLTETHRLTATGSIHGRTQTILDALDRVLDIRQPKLNATATTWATGWAATRTEYDNLGRMQRQSLPFDYGAAALYWNEREYDLRGRLKREDLANGGARIYDYTGLVTTVTESIFDENGLLRTVDTEKEEDAKGRVIRVTDALSGTTTYHYDGFDNLIDTYAPGGVHIHVDYDDRGFKSGVDDPDMGSWSYAYNAYGELVSQTDAKGQITTLTYDTLGRLKTRAEAEGTTTWTYDGPGGALTVPMIGRLYNVSQVEGGIETYAETTMYDAQSRPLNVTTTIDDVAYDTTYGYDAYGRLASVEYPESFATVINQAPDAVATANPSVKVLPGSVTLLGGASTDADNFPAPLDHQWTQTAGPGVTLSGAASDTATFTPAVPGTYGFLLDVTDTDLSDTDSVSVQVQPSAPGAANAPASPVTSTSYTVSWTAPTYGVTANTSYQLLEATNSTFTANARTITASGTSAAITGRANNATYYYKARACEGAVCGPYGASDSTTVRLAPGTPGTLSASPVSTDTGAITVSWGTASGSVSKYVLEEANGSFTNGVTRSWNVTSGTSQPLTQTTPGTWLYRVRAYNTTVPGGYSNTDSTSVTLPAALPTPTATLDEQSFGGSYTISWPSGGSGVIRYELDKRFNHGSWLRADNGTDLTFTEYDPFDGTYEFRVRTCKATGCGAWSPTRMFVYDVQSGCGFCATAPDDGGTTEPPAEPTPAESTEPAPADGGETGATNDSTTASDTSQIAVIPGTSAKSLHPGRVQSSPFAAMSGNNDIAANDASQAVIPGTPGIQSSASRAQPVQVNGTRSRNGFRAMHPARPYDLARGIGENVHATPARPIKTGLATLAASASTTTTGYRFKVVYEYDAWSHLVRVKNAEPNGVTYWESNTSDAAGHVIDEQYGNGVMTTHVYDPRSGLVQEITSSNTAAAAVQALAYDWDTAGNLVERRDERVALTEHFNYDDLNRLDNSTLTTPVTGTFTNLDLGYDAAGNIATKSGVGSYAYNSTRRHALTDLTRPDGSVDTFDYDANGNFISSTTGKTVTWTSYNYPRRTEHGTNAVNFEYGPDRQRYKEEIYSGGTLQSRRLTVNGYFERVTESGATTDKHYIRAGSKVIAIHDRKSDFLHETHYLHRDHLGSVDTITDDDGNVTVPRMSFDAFGLRRNALDWTDGFPTNTELEQIRDITTRGYTGHQMIDAVKLVHMNGRVYDPELGRFLSPDPNIPHPYITQSYNRYSYVRNNPLSFTDPSGFVDEKEEEPKFIDETELSEREREKWEECQRQGLDCAAERDARGQWRIGVKSEVTKTVDGIPTNVDKNIPVTKAEREMLANGDLAGFWRSRGERGDPWAEDGLALWDPENPSVSDEARTAATLLKGKVYAAMVLRNGESLSLDQFNVELQKIGMAIAKEHVLAIDDLGGGIVGLSQSTQYHHTVFARFGLPPTTYGATLVEPAWWNGFWSYESQARFVNEYIYEYCKGCPN